MEIHLLLLICSNCFAQMLISYFGFGGRPPRPHLIRTARASCLPLVRGVELDGQHVQSVPGSNADSPEQAEQSNHGRLAVAEGQEETADARDDTGARWRWTKGEKDTRKDRVTYEDGREIFP